MAASLPSRSATYSSSWVTVGSSPKTSSPRGASIMARRMPSVGRVTVSLRRSNMCFLHPSLLRLCASSSRSGSWPNSPANRHIPQHTPQHKGAIMGRRGRGDGSVYQRKDGSWVAQFQGKYHYAQTENAAKQKLYKMLTGAEESKPKTITR